jgi:hypothetical protein
MNTLINRSKYPLESGSEIGVYLQKTGWYAHLSLIEEQYYNVHLTKHILYWWKACVYPYS